MNDTPAGQPLIDRDTLYEEVWATPMTALAKKYGLSDQGLRKVCIGLQIPLPQVGHWARAAVGRAPPRPALKPYSETKEVARRAKKSRERKETVKSEREAWVPPAATVDDQTPVKWHRALKEIRDKVKEGVKRATELKRVYDWEQKHPGKHYPYRDGLNFWGSWEHFVDKGLLAIDTHKRCALRVSVMHADRALRLLNAIALHAAENGLGVGLEDNERLELKQADASIQLRVAETFDIDERMEKPNWSDTPRKVKTNLPTGRLRVIVGRAYDETTLTDKTGELLETRMEEIWDFIQRKLADAVAANREREEWNLRYAEEQRRREERERLEEERRQLEAQEQRRRGALYEEAATWQRTSNLRSYLRELDDRAVSGSPPEGFREWRAWAGQVLEAAEAAERVPHSGFGESLPS